MNIAEIIKRCSLDAVEASIPCDAVFGTVEKTEPLKIQVGDTLLPEELVAVAEHLKYKAQTITLGIYERTVVISEGLKAGDTVVLLRKRGGESYIAVGKTGG